MTTETEAATVSQETKLRADRIRRNAFIVLFLNLTVYPLTHIFFEVLFPELASGWSFSPEEAAIMLSWAVAFLAAAHVCRGYEIEFRERASNNPELSRSAAIIQFALRLIGWTVVSSVSLVTTMIFIILYDSVFGR